MKLTELERTILESLRDNELTTLRMITENIRKSEQTTSKQKVWNALQLLHAKGLIVKVERGVYRLNKEIKQL